MPFGLSCSVVRPVIPLLKAGRHDFELLNLIFRQRGIFPKAWKVPESEKNRAEICCGENCVTHPRFSHCSVDVQATRRASLKSSRDSSFTRSRRIHERGLGAPRFDGKVGYENITICFRKTSHDSNRVQLCCKHINSGARGQSGLCVG